MQIINNPRQNTWSDILKRPTQTVDDIEATVTSVFNEVRRDGDLAIKKYTERFDGVKLDSNIVSIEDIQKATKSVSEELKKAISLAKQNIETFHSAQKTTGIKLETTQGVTCWQEKRPIEKVGLYIPGGTAPLFSTVLMLAIPAQIAGCKEIVLCSPPNKEGNIASENIYAAQ
jgi:histidinol dehydrogenase